MDSPVRRETRHYRRRILAICGVVTVLGFIVTAPIFVRRVEADLEQRVPTELADAGFPGLTATFDGQDGTLSCVSPLTDPEAARRAAYDVWGVRAIELDRSCRVNVGGGLDVAATASSSVADSEPTTPDESVDATVASVVTSTTEPISPSFDTVAAAVAGSPQLSLLTVLLQEADLAAELGDPAADPITLFAPTDAAFEAMPADTLADLRADPERLRRLLVHHVSADRIMSTDLVTGPLTMSDGLEVEVDADVPSIAGIPITVTDIEAATGVVHIIDGVIVPDDLELTESASADPVDATSDGGVVTLSGTVATEAVRATLTGAATADGVTVADELVVDPSSAFDTGLADELAPLIEALSVHLFAGSAGFDGETMYLTGTYLTEIDRAAAAATAAELGIEADLTPLPVATDEDAAALEAELNEYVQDHPVLFEPGSAQLADDSAPVLDHLAELALGFDGISITVEGHTDSDGSEQQNLVLSQFRALAVKLALVARGLPDTAIDVEGFGSQQPVLVDGVEDKVASRRVQFRVVTAS